MKLSQIREYWPIFEAAKAGKTIQRFDNGGWWDCDPNQSCVSFRHAPEKYRIKPEPKLRPWKAEEVPVGALMRWKHFKHATNLIVCRDDYGQFGIIESNYGLQWITKDEFCKCEHSTDNGKTWKPCGVEE